MSHSDNTDAFSLSEGAELLVAQRAKYIDELVTEPSKPSWKSKRIQNAEALFVGEAFDDVGLAIKESSLTEDEQGYLLKQFLAFLPTYSLTSGTETSSRQVEIEVDPALRSAVKNDTGLLKSILIADSRARVLSANIDGVTSTLIEPAGDMILIHALLEKGSGINGEQIDFTANPIVTSSIVIPGNVAHKDFTTKEREGQIKKTYIKVIKEGTEPTTLQALQLLREIHHASEDSSIPIVRKYQTQGAFYTLGFTFKMIDFGHINAEGDLQCEGFDPSTASNLRQRLAEHLDDYDINEDRRPLMLDEVVSAARSAIGAAHETVERKSTELEGLETDYESLGSEALHMAAQGGKIDDQLSESLKVNQELVEEAANTARSHETQIEQHQEKEAKLHGAKDKESLRADKAEARLESLQAAIETLQAELEEANSKMFGSASARKQAWDDFERKSKS